VVAACAVLVEELLRRCPRLTILATSREPLRCGGEHVWRVAGFAPPEAVELFAARAAEADPGFVLTDANVGDVAEACARVDGMPLGIELAAARIGVLFPAQIAARLRESLDVLGSGARTALTRQQTLRATIAWSYDLLDEQEATLVRRLSVFTGSFDVGAAEAVCSGGAARERDVLDLLARLVTKSLLTVEDAGAARYRLLDTIRQFACELLEARDERADVESRLRAWAQQLAEIQPDVAALDLDHDSIRAALASGLVADPEAALLLATTVWRLWLDRTYLTEGSRRLRAALGAATAPTPTRVGRAPRGGVARRSPWRAGGDRGQRPRSRRDSAGDRGSAAARARPPRSAPLSHAVGVHGRGARPSKNGGASAATRDSRSRAGSRSAFRSCRRARAAARAPSSSRRS